MEENSFNDTEYLHLLTEYIERVKDKGKVIGVILFGSLAKNEQLSFPKSDIDLIAIAKDLPNILV